MTKYELTISKALDIRKNFSTDIYTTWDSGEYCKVKVCRLNDEVWLTHKADERGCRIKGISNDYGYNGLIVDDIEIIETNGKAFLRITSHPRWSFKSRVDYFPLVIE